VRGESDGTKGRFARYVPNDCTCSRFDGGALRMEPTLCSVTAAMQAVATRGLLHGGRQTHRVGGKDGNRAVPTTAEEA